MSDDGLDTVIPVIIGILTATFVGALIALVLICRRKYCKGPDYLTRQYLENEPDNNLVGADEELYEDAGYNGVELDDVRTRDRIDLIIQDDHWVSDVTGLAPHCLAILKIAHLLTDKLVSMSLNSDQQLQSPETMTELVSVARRIGPRVDDVVNAMYPPLDPRLLEARCSALVLSVSHLVLLTKSTSRLTTLLDWVDQSLADVDDHLQALRQSSIAFEAAMLSNGVAMPTDAPVDERLVQSERSQSSANDFSTV